LADSETNTQLGDRRRDATKVVPIKQIRVVILSCREYELGRICSRHIDEHGADTTKICVAVIETEPISRRPVICGHTAPEWSSLQTNDRFSTAPHASCAGGVTGDDEHVSAVAGNAAMSPDTTFSSRCRPGSDIDWIVNVYTNNPTMIAPAVAEISGVRHVNNSIHKSQCTSVFLHQ